jgi:ATPase subunit of ABC transporter with duplicated ATPase domains
VTYGTLDWYKEQWDYWHKQYQEASRRANSAVAEAKKSKERLITAIRMMQTVKAERDQFEDMLNRIGEAYAYETSQYDFNEAVYTILEERNRD